MKEGAKEILLMLITGAILFVNCILIYIDPPHDEKAALMGLFVLGIGASLFAMAVFYVKGNRGEKLITAGPYGLVRNPMYLGAMIMFFSHILLGQSWIVATGAVAAIVCCYKMAMTEERKNQEKFGSEYKLYMDAVPRINILAGIAKSIHRK